MWCALRHHQQQHHHGESGKSEENNNDLIFLHPHPLCQLLGWDNAIFFGRVISGSDVAVINTITADGDHEQID